MRRVDDPQSDPEIGASLQAIDATLAGEPVDPQHAELAELALLLASERPEIDAAFASSLDGLIDRRFAKRAGAKARRRWLFAPSAMVGVAAAAAVVVVIASGGFGSSLGVSASSSSASSSSASSAGALAPDVGGASAGHASSSGAAASSAPAAKVPSVAPAERLVPPAASAPTAAAPTAAGSGTSASPQPPANGRKIIQSASLNLAVAPSRMDDVAQQVFDVIGAEKGIVNHSTVTATGGSDGYAEFQLSVPSSSLSQTMSELSRLRGANVVSRTDASQDVNGQFVSTNRRLADARTLRTALLKQLAGATTTAEIDSLTGRIHDAEAAIASDQATLARLNGQVNYSQITLTINATVHPVVLAPHSGHSFTIGKAAHDAGRVLTVAAGVGLIALAALVPVALIGALVWWVAAAIRRRRREQALDLA